MDCRNLGSELNPTTLSGREFQVFMMRSLKNAALKREALCFLNNLYSQLVLKAISPSYSRTVTLTLTLGQ